MKFIADDLFGFEGAKAPIRRRAAARYGSTMKFEFIRRTVSGRELTEHAVRAIMRVRGAFTPSAFGGVFSRLLRSGKIVRSESRGTLPTISEISGRKEFKYLSKLK